MFLKIKNIQRITIISLISIIFSDESTNNTFYSYHEINSSPNSLQFDHLLKSDYESSLLHRIDNHTTSTPSENYEKFLNSYYKQYKKENISFIQAIVEPDVFYISTSIGTSNIIIGENNYSFGKTMGFHIDSPYAFKLIGKTIVIGLKSSYTSLPPLNSVNWDNFRSINISSTYSLKFGKRIYMLSGVGITQNTSNSNNNLLPLISLDFAYELPWKPFNIPFDVTICSSGSWDIKNISFGINILLCKPYKINLER